MTMIATSATEYSFDLTPPFRPSLASLGGAAKRDDARFPPDPVTMPTAMNWNFFARMFEGLGKFVPFISFQISYIAGTPTLVNVRSMRPSLEEPSLFTVTDQGDGLTRISWAAVAAQFPQRNDYPRIFLLDDGTFYAPTFDLTMANSVLVKTRDNTGAPVDADFVIDIFGT